MRPWASTRASLAIKAENEGYAMDQPKTNRVPLSRVFDHERNYLFSMKTNVRSYEWGVEEAETLLSDIRESLETADEDEYELGSFILVLSQKREKHGQFQDVHESARRPAAHCHDIAHLGGHARSLPPA